MKKNIANTQRQSIMLAMKACTENFGDIWDLPSASNISSMMDECSLKQLADMASFIQFCKDRPNKMFTPSYVGSNLAHDLGGISRHERCFLPRTTGYAKHLES